MIWRLLPSLFLTAFLMADERPPAILGSVQDAGGYAVEATIICTRTDDPRERYVTETKNGEFRFERLPSASYRIEAVPPKGFFGISVWPVQYRFPQTVSVPITVPFNFTDEWNSHTIQQAGDPATVAGELSTWRGPAANLQLCLASGQRRHCDETDDLGRYYLIVPPGPYRLTLRDGDSIVVERDVQLPEIQTTPISPVEAKDLEEWASRPRK